MTSRVNRCGAVLLALSQLAASHPRAVL